MRSICCCLIKWSMSHSFFKSSVFYQLAQPPPLLESQRPSGLLSAISKIVDSIQKTYRLSQLVVPVCKGAVNAVFAGASWLLPRVKYLHLTVLKLWVSVPVDWLTSGIRGVSFGRGCLCLRLSGNATQSGRARSDTLVPMGKRLLLMLTVFPVATQSRLELAIRNHSSI